MNSQITNARRVRARRPRPPRALRKLRGAAQRLRPPRWGGPAWGWWRPQDPVAERSARAAETACAGADLALL